MIIDKLKIDDFKLMAGAPIEIPESELLICQPKLYEIAAIGEELFYHYLGFLMITKEMVLGSISDPLHRAELEFKSEYEIIKILMKTEPEIEAGITILLKLLIKNIEIIKFNDMFIFIGTKEGQQHIISDHAFSHIKEIAMAIFSLSPPKKEEKGFNPANSLAESIAEKLKKRKEALEKSQKIETSQGKKDQSVLADFISILAVGLHLSIKDILNLTLFQTFNLMKRFGMYNQYQLQVQAMLQGADGVELIDWFQKI